VGSTEQVADEQVPVLSPAPVPAGGGGRGEAATRVDADRPARGAVPPSAALWCDGVRKRYGRRTALDGVGLEVGRGEVLGLLGPNGAGKTSLIKILLGLVRADAGEVMILGRPGSARRSRAGVGYLPELFRFQPWLTADEVLALHARLARVRWNAARGREALARVGLVGRERERVGGFSKGMQQRLGLAVALIGDPELVILDEPTSALDPLGRVDVRDLVVSLRERGAAVVLNSHLIGEVERVCDRVVILDRGRVVASGGLAELLGRPQVRLRLEGVGPDALDRLARAGTTSREPEPGVYLVDLGSGPQDGPDHVVPALVADLVGLGVRVHAVEPTRITLEDKLLDVLRGSEASS
jgi:ABC-2 type transport system ATP-binding protein